MLAARWQRNHWAALSARLRNQCSQPPKVEGSTHRAAAKQNADRKIDKPARQRREPSSNIAAGFYSQLRNKRDQHEAARRQGCGNPEQTLAQRLRGHRAQSRARTLAQPAAPQAARCSCGQVALGSARKGACPQARRSNRNPPHRNMGRKRASASTRAAQRRIARGIRPSVRR